MPAPAITHMPILEPSDTQPDPWIRAGREPRDYLGMLDGIGDHLEAGHSGDFIAPEILGPWAIDQMMNHEPPPGATAPAVAYAAEAMGFDLLAARVTSALPEIAAADAETGTSLLDGANLAGPWKTGDTVNPGSGAIADHFAETVANWVETNMPRIVIQGSKDHQRAVSDRLQADYPEIWKIKRERVLGKELQALAEDMGFDTFHASSTSLPIPKTLGVNPTLYEGGDQLFMTLNYRDTLVVLDLEKRTLCAKVAPRNYVYRRNELWEHTSAPALEINVTTYEIETVDDPSAPPGTVRFIA